MKSQQYLLRNVGKWGALAIAALLSSCSPLASSIAKQGGNNNTTIPSLGGLSGRTHILTFSARVVSDQSQSITDQILQGGPGVTIGLLPVQVEAFKSSGTIEIELSGGTIPSSITALLSLSLSDFEIADHGLAQATVATLKANDDHSFVLTLSSSLTEQQASRIRDHLVAVNLVVAQ